ncbi:GNAT family N-acetyltransferase [Streptomyces rimosus]|uniref:GNAT family N-acetyltransferase n=1 Tax=Streptomyces rimosus TaxID=1927 RepID=UPI00067DB443|nr:GNAT family protein [Streptomyces rimosus]
MADKEEPQPEHGFRFWPPHGIRIRTPRLELRLPDTALLDDLAAVSADGVHDPTEMPFSVPWTDGSPEERGRSTFQYQLGLIAEWRPERWAFGLAVMRGGKPVGLQELAAADFGVTREAETGSWLGLAHQNQGIGTEMRAAALHFAFERLGAHAVTSAAMTDNTRSLAVSRKLGYVPDGVKVIAVRGEARTLRRLRLDRERWEAHRTVPVEVAGWTQECRELFAA